MGTLTFQLLVLQLVLIAVLPVLFFAVRYNVIQKRSPETLAKVVTHAFWAWLVLAILVLVFVGGSGALPIADPDYPDPLEYYFLSSVALNIIVLGVFVAAMLIARLLNYSNKRKDKPAAKNLP